MKEGNATRLLHNFGLERNWNESYRLEQGYVDLDIGFQKGDKRLWRSIKKGAKWVKAVPSVETHFRNSKEKARKKPIKLR